MSEKLKVIPICTRIFDCLDGFEDIYVPDQRLIDALRTVTANIEANRRYYIEEGQPGRAKLFESYLDEIFKAIMPPTPKGE